MHPDSFTNGLQRMGNTFVMFVTILTRMDSATLGEFALRRFDGNVMPLIMDRVAHSGQHADFYTSLHR